MAGVAENLNVRVTLTLEKKQRLKWCVGGNDFRLSDYRTTMKRLSNDFSTPLWELYFDRYCSCQYFKIKIQNQKPHPPIGLETIYKDSIHTLITYRVSYRIFSLGGKPGLTKLKPRR